MGWYGHERTVSRLCNGACVHLCAGEKTTISEFERIANPHSKMIQFKEYRKKKKERDVWEGRQISWLLIIELCPWLAVREQSKCCLFSKVTSILLASSKPSAKH